MNKYHLIICLIILSIISLFIGVSNISLIDLFNDPDRLRIFLISRVPRLISILIVGSGMSVCGVVMQQMTGNRFVSPSTAGTFEFCKLGILFAILVMPSASISFKMLLAFIFSLVGTSLFMMMINHMKYKDGTFVPLIGIMFGGIVSSLTSFIAYRYDLIQNINSWLQGRFTLVVAGSYELLYIGIPVFIIIYLYTNQFTIASLGNEFASNLGLNYRLVVNIGLAVCALMSSIVVVTIGSIPFIGVIIPNIVSKYKGDNLKDTLPIIAISGALFVLVCDMIARILIAPHEIPIGVVCGGIGSFIFLFLILRRPKNAKA